VWAEGGWGHQADISGFSRVLLGQTCVQTILQNAGIRKSNIIRHPKSNEGHTGEEELRNRSLPLRLGSEAGVRESARTAHMLALQLQLEGKTCQWCLFSPPRRETSRSRQNYSPSLSRNELASCGIEDRNGNLCDERYEDPMGGKRVGPQRTFGRTHQAVVPRLNHVLLGQIFVQTIEKGM